MNGEKIIEKKRNRKIGDRPRALTGDRPTGHLHLGHYIGSLRHRFEIQEGDKYEQLIMIADIQALSDNFATPDIVRDNICNVFCDYLSAGIDPRKSTIFLQSMVPELYELTVHYMTMVTVNRLERNPTVKSEIQQKGFHSSIPVSFFCYPISQAADITAFDASIVPVGDDQLPMIEQTNEIVRRFNNLYCTDALQEVSALVPKSGGRLIGIDGAGKASKSMNNAIYLSDDDEILRKKIHSMYTDPDHLRINDPGKIEGNVVFEYLAAFYPDKEQVEDWKAQYRKGGLGDMFLKNSLLGELKELLKIMRDNKSKLMEDLRLDSLSADKCRREIFEILIDGSKVARAYAQDTLKYVREAIGINY